MKFQGKNSKISIKKMMHKEKWFAIIIIIFYYKIYEHPEEQLWLKIYA